MVGTIGLEVVAEVDTIVVKVMSVNEVDTAMKSIAAVDPIADGKIYCFCFDNIESAATACLACPLILFFYSFFDLHRNKKPKLYKKIVLFSATLQSFLYI